ENFYTDSNGSRVENPKYLRATEKKLAKAQRQLARKKKGSKNRLRAKKKVVKLHSKIKHQRKDFAHKQSRKLINKYDLIVYENLNIRAMVGNEHLAKSISDVAWGMFFEMLDYKAVEAGKRTIDIAPHNTSQLCSNAKCGEKVVKALSQRWHKCPFCGLVLNRDHNAARNILARGINLLQAEGLSVSAPAGLALAGLLKGEPWEISAHLLPSSLVPQTDDSN
ncbi:MAG: transposase, partial [Blastocatellia bacterium]|nr:transposase [Blastocatellia bacterium]